MFVTHRSGITRSRDGCLFTSSKRLLGAVVVTGKPRDWRARVGVAVAAAVAAVALAAADSAAAGAAEAVAAAAAAPVADDGYGCGYDDDSAGF